MTRLFDTGATRDSDANKLDFEGFISPRVLRKYAEYMHRCRLRNQPPGQALRASDNWQKGIPKDAYVKSLIRHVMELWEQWDLSDTGHPIDMDVACAILFNIQGFIFEMTRPASPSTAVVAVETEGLVTPVPPGPRALL